VLQRDFFEQDPVTCARALIGTTFRWQGTAGLVVETEAYSDQGDEACHTFVRTKARTFISENGPGTAYVYLNYGIHWLTNILVKSDSGCGFVLLRALAPVEGLALMRRRRQKTQPTDLCSGPGKLSQALAIHGGHHGQSLVANPQRAFFPPESDPPSAIHTGPRIGISKAKDLPWRFGLADSPHLSAPFHR